MKRVLYWLIPLAGWLGPSTVLTQERFYEWRWEMHPIVVVGMGNRNDGDDVFVLASRYRRLHHWAPLVVG